jgi:hypothetical protein
MPRSVQLPEPRPSYEEMVKQLRIPKARQKELRAIMDRGRARMAAAQGITVLAAQPGENLESASTAR